MRERSWEWYVCAVAIAIIFALVAVLLLSEPTKADSTPTVDYAKGYARRTLGATQYRCLDHIAIRESHWNPLAHNRTSGAHGIGQALPWTKMRRFGPDAWHNPVTQVKWMTAYVHARYGSACNAWAFWQQHGWY